MFCPDYITVILERGLHTWLHYTNAWTSYHFTQEHIGFGRLHTLLLHTIHVHGQIATTVQNMINCNFVTFKGSLLIPLPVQVQPSGSHRLLSWPQCNDHRQASLAGNKTQ